MLPWLLMAAEQKQQLKKPVCSKIAWEIDLLYRSSNVNEESRPAT
jgi:hypothetical protein